MRRTLTVALSMGLALGQAHAQRPDPFAPPPPVAQGQTKGPYLFDLPKLYPAAFKLWQQTIPRSMNFPSWLSKFDGVAAPIRDVTVEGKSMKFSTVCMPHDCGDNEAGVLFSPQQNRIVAVVHMAGQNQAPTVMVIGEMSGPEVACIGRLMHLDNPSTC